uniref:Phospholipase A2-like central domain-containing protein n=1 Tax=Balaenoptera musculus TaxID=9771 RepID=A0A8C0CBP8_BALMU
MEGHPLGSLAVLPAAHSSLLNLKSMVEANTGRNAILSFVGYGCYCRGWWGGHGLPMDEADSPRCCLAHDCCYEKLKRLSCQPVLNGYQFRVANGTVICELPSLALGWRAVIPRIRASGESWPGPSLVPICSCAPSSLQRRGAGHSTPAPARGSCMCSINSC